VTYYILANVDLSEYFSKGIELCASVKEKTQRLAWLDLCECLGLFDRSLIQEETLTSESCLEQDDPWSGDNFIDMKARNG
jgi:hypothetical protein